MKPPNRIVLMGVSGAGKTTAGGILADKLGGLFVDGDDLHSQANIDKMRPGIALTDDDRRPWLDLVARVLRERDGARPLIVACSALKRSYRQRLGEDFHLIYLKGTSYIYLKGTSSEIARRLQIRQLQDCDGHFVPISLIESQFEALEAPEISVVMDMEQSPHEIVEKIILALS